MSLNVANFIQDRYSSLVNGDYNSAYEYFKKVLVINPGDRSIRVEK